MRYLLTISYIGTAYHGWQVQENALAVQPVVQDALHKMLGLRPALSGLSLIHISIRPPSTAMPTKLLRK